MIDDFLIVVVDVETTGFNVDRDIITEVGAAVLYPTKETGWAFDDDRHFYLAVDQTYARGHPTEMMIAFESWIVSHDRPVMVTSYNMSFDRRFLDHPPWSCKTIQNWSWAEDKSPNLCIMKAVKKNLRLEKNVKLKVAADKFGIPFDPDQWHSALYDARAAAKILLQLLKMHGG